MGRNGELGEVKRKELYNAKNNCRTMVQNHGRNIAERIRRTGRRTKTAGRKLDGEVKGTKSGR